MVFNQSCDVTPVPPKLFYSNWGRSGAGPRGEGNELTVVVMTAPCCWGVEKGVDPNQPGWERVLDEVSGAGYAGLELGPYGFLPPDAGRVSKAFAARGLHIAAGTIFDNLVDPASRARLLGDTAAICALITRLPAPERLPGQRFAAPYLTIMDFGTTDRDFDAGHPSRARRLTDDEWTGMVDNIRAIATLARDTYGVRAVIHPHAGGFIEFEDEIARIVADIPADLAGLCIDTGHTFYARMDPVKTLGRYADRVDYIHFKDIDAAVFDRVMGERIRFFEACAQGVMCPIGDGCIDYPAIRRLLDEIGYAGLVTVEQERDPRNANGTLHDVRRSRDYLKSAGF